MKTIKLDSTIKDITGAELPGVNGPITSRDVLIQCIGVFFSSPNALENIQAYGIGQKLYSATDTIDLEDADFKLLEKAFEKSVKDQRFTVSVVTHLYQLFESVE